jgi:hypothetical protein
MCLLKKLKFLKPSEKKRNVKEKTKNKRIKKNFKLRRREARRRRRAKKRMNKIMKYKFDAETLSKVKDDVLSFLNASPMNNKKMSKVQSFAKSDKESIKIHDTHPIRIMGNVREIRAPLLGKRADLNKGVDTTDEELEEDGFRGKGQIGCGGKRGCWRKGCTCNHGVNNSFLYDICPVKDVSLSQAPGKRGALGQPGGKGNDLLGFVIKIHLVLIDF